MSAKSINGWRGWLAGGLVVVAAFAVVQFLAGGFGTNAVRAAGGDETRKLEGQAAPDFSLEGVDGKPVKLSDLKGKVVLLDFWATWCGPCRVSLPHVQKLSADKELTDKGLTVLAVNVQEAKEKVQEFLKKENYTFTVPLDAEGKASEAYKIEGIPTSAVVGRDGVIRKIYVGIPPAKELDAAIAAALAEKPKDAK